MIVRWHCVHPSHTNLPAVSPAVFNKRVHKATKIQAAENASSSRPKRRNTKKVQKEKPDTGSTAEADPRSDEGNKDPQTQPVLGDGSEGPTEASQPKRYRSRSQLEAGTLNEGLQSTVSSKEVAELSNLMVDPKGDDLFDPRDFKSFSTGASRDPYAVGRAAGSAAADMFGTGIDESLGSEEEGNPWWNRDGETHAQILKRWLRHAKLMKLEEKAIHLHHKHRESNVSIYGQALTMARIMEHLEGVDEESGLRPNDFVVPSWIRATFIMEDNWEVMEQTAQDVGGDPAAIDDLLRLDPAMQERLDRYDPELLLGERDGPPPPDPLDRFMDGILPGTEGATARQDSSTYMQDILSAGRDTG